jgi:hypothetical protein
VDPRLAAAVLDNAMWCDAVCAAHGRPGRFEPDAWTNAARTPSGYPDAVTLIPSASGASILERIDRSSGSSIKDSFADVDLEPFGFRVLFGGRWLARGPGAAPASRGPAAEWRSVSDAAALGSWATDHGLGDVFAPALLDVPWIHVLSAHDDGGRRTAGAVATVADAAVGISNVFAVPPGEFAGAFAAATVAIQHAFPGRAIVGYLDDDRLAAAAAAAAGYEPIGPLRVWIRDD